MKKLLAILALGAVLVIVAGSAEAPSVATIFASGPYIVNSDRVNVRGSPDVAGGKVIGQLNKGAVVVVKEMTRLYYPVQGMRAAWFHISNPDGWIYGYFLDPAE